MQILPCSSFLVVSTFTFAWIKWKTPDSMAALLFFSLLRLKMRCSLAKALVAQDPILGVVGHLAADCTLDGHHVKVHGLAHLNAGGDVHGGEVGRVVENDDGFRTMSCLSRRTAGSTRPESPP